MLSGPIDDAVANSVIAQLLFLDAQDPDKDILSLYLIHQVGVSLPGLAIFDTMNFHQCRCTNYRNWDGGFYGGFPSSGRGKGQTLCLT